MRSILQNTWKVTAKKPSVRAGVRRVAGRNGLVGMVFVFATVLGWASGPMGSLSGTVADPSGAVVAGATVALQKSGNQSSGNDEHNSFVTGFVTGDDGSYSFPALAAGRYSIKVSSAGFKPYRQDGLEVSAGAAARFDVSLTLNSENTSVEVSAEVLQIDTSTTQMGEEIAGTKITSVPLNGRSFTDLLAIQPGVVPASSAQPNAVVMSGCTNTPPSGDLNPGDVSVSGQRETANGFMVNGSVVEEDFNNGTAVVPNLDSIEELRVLTSNFDAEYGNFSGGQVLVATKSGGNQIHGSAFEFLRNTDLDSRNYFGSERATYDRNQYGGTVGGPIRKEKAYFFVDYQGTQMTQGQETGNIVVPSQADRTGNITDLGAQLTGHVSTDFWAGQLSAKLGYAVAAGEPYSAVFPNAVIPQKAWSAPATSLM